MDAADDFVNVETDEEGTSTWMEDTLVPALSSAKETGHRSRRRPVVENSVIASDPSDSSGSESALLSSGGLHHDEVHNSGRNSSSMMNGASSGPKRKRPGMSARERNLRRLESNERERLRMHSLNAAFEVP